jgi:hypothetical protein
MTSRTPLRQSREDTKIFYKNFAAPRFCVKVFSFEHPLMTPESPTPFLNKTILIT